MSRYQILRIQREIRVTTLQELDPMFVGETTTIEL